ncbi:Hnrnpul1 [Symbiodinium natans]|uniref:Hnrnpul1 protein n=1 Tax=Symbiodinium natans TaxID=878477 RepID=A0A812L1Y8_9DINO|nr:Hnrnpul1 [Symbiodinium natans]
MKRCRSPALAGWDPSTKDAEVEVEQDPLTGGCYKVACASTARAWIGLRGRPGVVTGQYCFEVKVGEGLLRVGWSSSTAALALGTDAQGFGFGGTGKKSHRNKFADYGIAFEVGDVVSCCLDRDQRQISFGVNGIWYGKAFDIPKAWDGVALFPAVCAREAFRATGYFGCPDHPKVPYGCDFWPLGAAYPEDVVESGGPVPEPSLDLEESAERRGARSGRFAKMARVDQDLTVLSTHKPVLDTTGSGTLIGRCRALERGYLRDAAKLRDPQQIRPMPVLREALRHCLSAGRAWSWEAEMLRAIRQDITVQHLDVDFMEEVCEVSCLRALANGDWAVFASCSSTLKQRPRAPLAGAVGSASSPGFRFDGDASRGHRLELRACHSRGCQRGFVDSSIEACSSESDR